MWDIEKQRIYQRSPHYRAWQREYKRGYNVKQIEEGRCPCCSAPLMEEETTYCVNCRMHVNRMYPDKAERGIL